MPVQIEKVSGGFSIDGLELKSGKCGCTSLAKCCYSWSKVKRKGDEFEFAAKMADPDTADTFEWSYTVSKDGVTVKVFVQDARDKVIFSGFVPPSAQEWEDKGWTVLQKEGDREDGALWRCSMCKWLYKEALEGTPFEDLPSGWKCPKCGVGKNMFQKIG